MKKSINKICLLVIMSLLLCVFTGCNENYDDHYDHIYKIKYLEKVEFNDEQFLGAEQGGWSDEKKARFAEVLLKITLSFPNADITRNRVKNLSNFTYDLKVSADIIHFHNTGTEILFWGYWGYETDKNNNIKFGSFPELDKSCFTVDKDDAINNKIIVGDFKDAENNTYRYTYGAIEENRLPIYPTYKFNRIYVKRKGMPSQILPSDDPNYNIYKSSYGETIILYDDKVGFSGTLTALLNPIAVYKMNGKDITFTDSDLSMLFSAESKDNKFNFIITLPNDLVVVEYKVICNIKIWGDDFPYLGDPYLNLD